jgi:hypothetical protein
MSAKPSAYGAGENLGVSAARSSTSATWMNGARGPGALLARSYAASNVAICGWRSSGFAPAEVRSATRYALIGSSGSRPHAVLNDRAASASRANVSRINPRNTCKSARRGSIRIAASIAVSASARGRVSGSAASHAARLTAIWSSEVTTFGPSSPYVPDSIEWKSMNASMKGSFWAAALVGTSVSRAKTYAMADRVVSGNRCSIP